jgi:hypothetical protein
LRNNIVAECGGYELYVEPGGENGFDSDRNCFYDVMRSSVVDWLGSSYSLGQFYTATGMDENSVQLDPVFANPDAADFRLQIDSPCIGVGEDGVDMGIYPHGSLTTRSDIDRALRGHKEGRITTGQVQELLRKYYQEE